MGRKPVSVDKQTEDMLAERPALNPRGVPYNRDIAEPMRDVTLQDAAKFVAESTPIIGDAMAAKEIWDELQKEEPNYYLVGALGGATIIGLIPGVGDAAAAAITRGAKAAAKKGGEVAADVVGTARAIKDRDLEFLQGRGRPEATQGVGANVTRAAADEPFKKTRPAYKLFVKRDEKLYPLFVNASDEIPVNQWLEADFPDVAFKGKTQAGGEGYYVPTKGAKRDPDRFYLDGVEITKKEYNKLGPNSKPFATIVRGEKSKSTGDRIIIPDEETRQKLIDAGFITEKTGRTKAAPYGMVTAVAARPGFHSSVNPVAEHLGPQDILISKDEAAKLVEAGINKKAIRTRGDQYYVKRRAEDQYWAEVEMADDTTEDLYNYMKEQGRTDINDRVPKGGSYSYVDGQADGDTWVVGGDMKVKKVLSREEAKAAQEAAGVKDLPYRDEVEAILGRKFAEGGLVGEDMYSGQQDYLLASSSGMDMEEGGSVDQQTAAIFKSARGYAEGGEVDPMLMEEGVDPVSGNEVPIGSTPEEVRDDIPAQLSEGEYVVPADVVRYYGVKFFEDLRNQAKMGWEEMDQNGRIGGEPVMQEQDGMEMVEPEDDLPFDISELQTIEAAEGTYVRGFAEGGFTLDDINIGAGFGAPTGATQSNTEQRMYKNPKDPSAPAIALIFINGKPSPQAEFYIDQGYVPAGQVEATKKTADVQQQVQQQSDSGDVGQMDPTAPKQEKVDWTKASADQFEKSLKGLESGFDNRLATGAASMFLGPVGGIAASIGLGSADRNKAYDMLEGINAQLGSKDISADMRDSLSKQRERLEKIVSTGDDGKKDDGLIGKSGIFGGKSSMYEGLTDTSGDGRVTFADTWLGNILGLDGQFGRQGATLAESRAGARRGGGSGTSTTTTTPSSPGGRNVGDNIPSSSAPTSSPRPQARPASVGRTVDTTDDARASRGSGSMSSGERASQSYQKQEDKKYGLMNKGGYIKKKK